MLADGSCQVKFSIGVIRYRTSLRQAKTELLFKKISQLKLNQVVTTYGYLNFH